MCSNKLCHFTFHILCIVWHNTRPYPCMQPCKQVECREGVHLPCGSPWSFGCVTQNAYLVSCVHCSASRNSFITCVNIHNYEHLGWKGFDLTACMCNTDQLSHACPTMHQIRLVDTLIIPQATQIWCSPATSSEGCSGWQWKGYLSTTHPDQKGLQLQEDAGSSSHWW